MISILFWNVGRESRLARIADVAIGYSADVVLLAEFVDDPGELLVALNEESVGYSYAPGIGNTKICWKRNASDRFRTSGPKRRIGPFANHRSNQVIGVK
jgi:hypothetical protein